MRLAPVSLPVEAMPGMIPDPGRGTRRPLHRSGRSQRCIPDQPRGEDGIRVRRGTPARALPGPESFHRGLPRGLPPGYPVVLSRLADRRDDPQPGRPARPSFPDRPHPHPHLHARFPARRRVQRARRRAGLTLRLLVSRGRDPRPGPGPARPGPDPRDRPGHGAAPPGVFPLVPSRSSSSAGACPRTITSPPASTPRPTRPPPLRPAGSPRSSSPCGPWPSRPTRTVG